MVRSQDRGPASDTRQSFYNTISNDLTAIVTAVQGGTGSSSQLVADVTKFASDRSTTLTTLEGDLPKVMTDRTQLVTDLTAEQNA